MNSNVATFALTGWTEDRLDGSCSEWICLIFFIHLYTQFFDMHNAAQTNFEFTYSTEQNTSLYLYKYIIILHGEGVVVNLSQELCCHHFI